VKATSRTSASEWPAASAERTLMSTSVRIRSDERRDATAVSATGSKPDADTCHVRPVTCLARPRWRAKNLVALSASNLGTSPWPPPLACNVFSFEAKASNNARPDWRSTCSSSHWSRNSIGTVICAAASVRDSCPRQPKTAAVILGSTAVDGTPSRCPA
jgi:hypothetical protein